MNWNILVIEGKENNKNFVSSGERKQIRYIILIFIIIRNKYKV